MSGVVDKVKDKVSGGSGKEPLSKGSRLPTIGALKENSPTEGSVDLGSLKGKSELLLRSQTITPTLIILF